ncbi:hypothetical protein HG264_10125 [Pseudomonas sp. gcc21]|uniref:hypothetical protein n=1 Tax=Pseudomonas sp. gcc21 TaxID=2726989 RepID=UPI001452419D|nr:hypothetical protein [Pseudomonas sp. gcc21]QJD59237.1 hypothetical protein HG264_10125 [Pseudomonas sp. gcc21]
MSVYTLARNIMQDASEQARTAGYSEQDLARALMSEVIAVYKRERSDQDIAHELNFLAENLDEDAEYAFMRP